MPNVGGIVRASDLTDLLESIGSSSNGIIGEIIGFPGNSVPKGTLICDGSEISREAYSELFAVIGTMNGEGDGTTTFNIPDLRDKWIKYAGIENSVGEILAEGLPNIYGTMNSADSQAVCGPVTGAFRIISTTPIYVPQGIEKIANSRVEFSASNYSNIYGNSTHVTPNSIVLLPCIRYE